MHRFSPRTPPVRPILIVGSIAEIIATIDIKEMSFGRHNRGPTQARRAKNRGTRLTPRLSHRPATKLVKEFVQGIRLTNHTVDGVAGFDRSVSGRLGGGSKFGDSVNRKVAQPWEDWTQIVANRDFESPTGFDDGNDRSNARSSLLTADADPISSFFEAFS